MEDSNTKIGGLSETEKLAPISPKEALKELAKAWPEIEDHGSGLVDLERLRDYMLPKIERDPVATVRLTQVINLINHKQNDPNLDSAPQELVIGVIDYAIQKHRIDAGLFEPGSYEHKSSLERMDTIEKIQNRLKAFSPKT